MCTSIFCLLKKILSLVEKLPFIIRLFDVKLYQHANGEDYVELPDNKNHSCKAQKTAIILKSSEFELRHDSKRKEPTLYIPHPTNKTLWYEYYSDGASYRCLECFNNTTRYSRPRKLVCAQLFGDLNGECYLKLADMEHVCQPFMKPELMALTNSEMILANIKREL